MTNIVEAGVNNIAQRVLDHYVSRPTFVAGQSGITSQTLASLREGKSLRDAGIEAFKTKHGIPEEEKLTMKEEVALWTNALLGLSIEFTGRAIVERQPGMKIVVASLAEKLYDWSDWDPDRPEYE